MYIYHALINALSAHMIHINLNMIFYTHVEHSPSKTVSIKYYMEHTCTHAPAMVQPNSAKGHHLGGYSKCAIKSNSHSFRLTCDKSTVSLLESGE